MKLNIHLKICIILYLVSLCLINTKKEESSVTNETNMAKIFTISIFVDQETSPAAVPSVGTIDAKSIKVPKEDELRGIYITFINLNNDLKPLLYESNGKYSIPYRKLSSDFQIQPTNNNGKILTVQLQKTASEFHTIKFQFEFDPQWDIITDDELNSLVSWLNKNRNERRNFITALKTLALGYAGEFQSQTQNAAAADNGVSGIDSQITSSLNILVEKENEIKKNMQDLKDIENIIVQSKNKIESSNDQLNNIKKKMDFIDIQIANKQSEINKMNTDLTKGTINSSALKTKLSLNEESLRNLIKSLQREVPNDSTLANAFDVLENQGVSELETLITKVFPK